MLYRRDLATRCDAALSRTALRGPLLAYRTREFQSDRDVRILTDHRPTLRAAAAGGAKSSDMVTVQPAGTTRETSRPSR